MADYEYKCPLDDPNVSPVVCLPDAGKTVRLVCPIRYHDDYPVERLGDPFIRQTWAVPRDFERPDPYPPDHGKFNLESFTQSLEDGGRVVVIEFEIPDEETSIQLQFYMTQYICSWKRVQNKLRQYTIMIRPSTPWEDKVEAMPYPMAPGINS